MINDDTPTVEYAIASQGALPWTLAFDFDLADEDNVKVYHYEPLVVGSAQTINTLTKDIDYTVTFDSGTSGKGDINILNTVDNQAKQTTGGYIVFKRETTPDQQTNFEDADTMPVEAIERALDKLTRIVQEKLSSNIDSPVGKDIVFPNPADKGIIAWDGTDGDLINVLEWDNIVDLDSAQELSGKDFSQDGVLEIEDSGNTTTENPLNVYASNLSVNGTTSIYFGKNSSSSYNRGTLAFGYEADGYDGNYVSLGVYGSTAPLRITGVGNVGIGGTPSSSNILKIIGNLDHNGSSDISGGLTVHGALNDGSNDLTATFEETNKAADGIGVTIPRQKILEIGAWNMDSTSSVNVAHGLTLSKIVGLRAVIINDIANHHYNLNWGSPSAGSLEADATDISLFRTSSGAFDNNAFDDGVMNRGYIIVDYID